MRKDDANWHELNPPPEFEPPIGMASLFDAWRIAIGHAAYTAWLRGAKAWNKPDGSMHIQAADAVKADWIRRNYLDQLSKLAQCNISIGPANTRQVSAWPYRG